ncbi:MAG: hypothetical protein PVF26_15690, partial [Desulfobacterales bacterium]
VLRQIVSYRISDFADPKKALHRVTFRYQAGYIQVSLFFAFWHRICLSSLPVDKKGFNNILKRRNI